MNEKNLLKNINLPRETILIFFFTTDLISFHSKYQFTNAFYRLFDFPIGTFNVFCYLLLDQKQLSSVDRKKTKLDSYLAFSLS